MAHGRYRDQTTSSISHGPAYVKFSNSTSTNNSNNTNNSSINSLFTIAWTNGRVCQCSITDATWGEDTCIYLSDTICFIDHLPTVFNSKNYHVDDNIIINNNKNSINNDANNENRNIGDNDDNGDSTNDDSNNNDDIDKNGDSTNNVDSTNNGDSTNIVDSTNNVDNTNRRHSVQSDGMIDNIIKDEDDLANNSCNSNNNNNESSQEERTVIIHCRSGRTYLFAQSNIFTENIDHDNTTTPTNNNSFVYCFDSKLLLGQHSSRIFNYACLTNNNGVKTFNFYYVTTEGEIVVVSKIKEHFNNISFNSKINIKFKQETIKKIYNLLIQQQEENNYNINTLINTAILKSKKLYGLNSIISIEKNKNNKDIMSNAIHFVLDQLLLNS
jgi:hypothetical protein